MSRVWVNARRYVLRLLLVFPGALVLVTMVEASQRISSCGFHELMTARGGFGLIVLFQIERVVYEFVRFVPDSIPSAVKIAATLALLKPIPLTPLAAALAPTIALVIGTAATIGIFHHPIPSPCWPH